MYGKNTLIDRVCQGDLLFYGMISKTGLNLSVLIISQTGMDWQTFATWYSFYKNLPDCSIKIICHRTKEVPFAYFQWTKRLKIPCIKIKPFSEKEGQYINWLGAFKNENLTNQPVLIVKPYVMAIDVLNNNLLSQMQRKNIWLNEDVYYINNQNVEDIINKYYLEGKEYEISPEELCVDAKSSEILHPLVCYKKGCGRWIDKAKGCPFSSAGGLITPELTANEKRVIKLWEKMVPLYQAVV